MLDGSNYSQDIFPDYQFLSPASQFKNRHESIMLVLDATVEGIKNIAHKAKTCTTNNLGIQANKK